MKHDMSDKLLVVGSFSQGVLVVGEMKTLIRAEN